MLQAPVLHADETPVAMLDPGSGKTKRAYVWAYARGEFDAQLGVVFDFCLGRGAQYPTLFLGGSGGPPGHEQPPWRGTLLTDQYSAYATVLDENTCSGRIAAACFAHCRRKFEELANAGASDVAQEAIRRIARIYHAEGQFAGMDDQQRLGAREELLPHRVGSRAPTDHQRAWHGHGAVSMWGSASRSPSSDEFGGQRVTYVGP